ncbi:MAG: aminoacyl-tRNA hydrolase [Armatimonadota bacterium]|nr:aminoacyl-tRNA hydrolase [Armatimonadota bacterium]MDR7444355.1 aminoacyl-tRNA hydrolase [Armatimonadota bacterium]MDR7569654.1 aminoacyl-tRNA hydrolase [Armatimonadota bacterium]MDR7614842.1 aminoacyl-tRNA hydrolase [Armatimonadota bacterium]
MWLVVGLGNPGRRYRGTRHNVGWEVVDRLCARWGIGVSQQEEEALVGKGEIGGLAVLLAKPLTYMNRSGEAVRGLVDRYGVRPQEVLVIYDDVDLPVGAIRIRPRGSSGGHHGMASVLEALGTSEIPRVRVGIGRPSGDAAEYVLSRFSPEERPLIREAVERAADAVETILREGLEAAMNRYNRRAQVLSERV